MPARNDGIVCRECGGAGCEQCGNTGYFFRGISAEPTASLPDIAPMPYGKILPDLTGAFYVNEPVWSNYLGPILCPACGSDHVVGLDSRFNPVVREENISPAGRWFCITCMDSWCYEREL